MIPKALDIVAIGDAIVDVIATAEDCFLETHGLAKGSMQLLSPAEADALYAAMGPAREISGGSAANSMAGVAALGLEAGFIGQVANDQLGAIFAHDMKSLGVRFDTPPIDDGLPTGRCLIIVTPDAQRTMNTCPGASHELAPERLDEAMIRSSSITFLEGYLWGPERPRQAMLRAAGIAHDAGRTVAFTLSESLCIPGRREGVLGMIESGMIDILFANEDEALLLAGAGDLDGALARLSPQVSTLVVTRGAEGALAIERGNRVDVAAVPVDKVIDTTGAGDQYAAGVMYGLTQGLHIETCAQLGSLAAAEVIGHFGPRPRVNLNTLAKERGLL